MADDIQYDSAWAMRLEKIYQSTDVVSQRRRVMTMLAPEPGEHILDIGSGPGFLAAEIGRRVGPNGCVAGIDVSPEMNFLASARCEDMEWVSIGEGDAADIPFSDEQFEAAVSTQVYEYVQDIEIALSELYRVLKPGGRAVILDTDWDTLIWNTSDRSRQRRVMELFAPHCAHPHLARQLPSLLRRAGFALLDAEVYTILNTEFDPDSYSSGMIEFIASYIEKTGQMLPEEIREWSDELLAFGQNGTYFFSNNRYIFTAGK